MKDARDSARTVAAYYRRVLADIVSPDTTREGRALHTREARDLLRIPLPWDSPKPPPLPESP